jgi:hypothetical protein
MDLPNGYFMKTTKATKDALAALEQALADIGHDSEPRREDEFTTRDMHEKLKHIMSLKVVQQKLKALYDDGKYTRRRIGCDYLYRKA